MRLLCMILLLAAISTVNRAEAKKSVPLWARWEHYQEEMGWQRTANESNALEVLEPDPDTDVGNIEPDPDDLEYLAIVIFCEAGADAQCDETRYMVGDVVLNRVADDRYPDTIHDVLAQKAQYGRFYWTGIVWPDRAKNPGNANAVARAREIAYNLLTDTRHSDLYGKGYIYQDCRVQGVDNVWSDGICFGR